MEEAKVVNMTLCAKKRYNIIVKDENNQEKGRGEITYVGKEIFFYLGDGKASQYFKRKKITDCRLSRRAILIAYRRFNKHQSEKIQAPYVGISVVCMGI